MLQKENRLQRESDFVKVFKKTKPVYFSNLVIRSLKRFPNTRSNGGNLDLPPRFGFIISNKTEKRAVRRNALKRQLRTIIQEFLPEMQPGIDIIIQVKRNFSYPYQQEEIRSEIKSGLERMGLMHNHQERVKGLEQ